VTIRRGALGGGVKGHSQQLCRILPVPAPSSYLSFTSSPLPLVSPLTPSLQRVVTSQSMPCTTTQPQTKSWTSWAVALSRTLRLTCTLSFCLSSRAHHTHVHSLTHTSPAACRHLFRAHAGSPPLPASYAPPHHHTQRVVTSQSTPSTTTQPQTKCSTSLAVFKTPCLAPCASHTTTPGAWQRTPCVC
jgi:hypothetical protein